MIFKKYHPKIFLLLTFIILFTIYLSLSWLVSRGDLSRTHLAYYNYLLSALYHKRLSVTPFLSATDLSWFNGQWYLYWGPAPILFIAPFFLIAKTQASDVIYTLAAGLANLVIFYLVIKEFDKIYQLKNTLGSLIFILINFALISPHFYLSLQGRIWHTNQIMATFFLLLFLLYYFKFLGNFERPIFLTLTTIFLNLAVLSRFTLIFYFSLFFPLLWHLSKAGRQELLIKSWLTIIFWTISFLVLTFVYNHARFGNIWETGISYVYIRSSEDIYIKGSEKRSLISGKYFIHNFETYFLNHLKFKGNKPFLEIDKEGNSTISLYPLLILVPALLGRKFLFGKKYSLFLKTALFGVVLPIFGYLMLYLATGWAQLGTRYILDIIPLLFILLLLVTKYIPWPIKVLLILYGALVNIGGAILFYAS